MAKTRSQTENIAIKKEEEEDCKPSLYLGRVRNTRSSDRISKRKPAIINNGSLPAQQVKAEEGTDTKALLKPISNHSKIRKEQSISQEQINQLIHYIVNDNMSVNKSSRKVNISYPTARYYYNVYKNDPEKKLPLPRDQARNIFTQEQFGNLIKYITQDKMTVKEASAKANMPYSSGHYYYNRYLKDPNHAVQQLKQRYTQDQKNEFIHYIINDKMSMTAASKKAKVNHGTATLYYHKYFKVLNPDVATPSHITTRKHLLHFSPIKKHYNSYGRIFPF